MKCSENIIYLRNLERITKYTCLLFRLESSWFISKININMSSFGKYTLMEYWDFNFQLIGENKVK